MARGVNAVSRRLRQLPSSFFHEDYRFFQQIISLIHPYMDKSYGTILDFGAGNSPYKDLFECKSYVSLDVAQNESRSIDLIVKPGEEIPLPEDSIDLALCMDVLEHCDEPKFVLQELRRVLKPGGHLLISVPFINREHEMPNDFFRYTSSLFGKVLNDNDFFDIEIRKVGNRWFTIYSVWNESIILNSEQTHGGYIGRLLRQGLRYTLIPILNMTAFSSWPSPDAGVYHHLFISCQKLRNAETSTTSNRVKC